MHFNLPLKYGLFVLLGCCFQTIHAQDEVAIIVNEIMEDQQINSLSALNGEELFHDLMTVYNKPININAATKEQLEQLLFLSDYQIENLLYYIYTSGPLVTMYELKAVPGWDARTIRWFLPFATIQAVTNKKSPLHLHQELLSRYIHIPELQLGFKRDSGNHYLGNRDALLLRMDGDLSHKYSWHILSEKDRGEQLLYDFVGASFQFRGKGLVRKVIVGDYKVRTGQGLVAWSGNMFGKTMELDQLRRKGEVLSMYRSAQEYGFFRGGALALGYKNLKLDAFGSKIQIDAVTGELDQEEIIKSIGEDGLHNTPSKLANKHAASLSAMGAHVSWNNPWFKPGFTYLYQPLTIPLVKISDESFAHIPQMDSWHNYSFDFFTSMQHLQLWGEMALQSHGSYAAIAGMSIFPHDAFQATLMYRNYASNYFSVYGSAFGESGDPSNEKGLFLGLKVIPSGQLTFNAALDLYEFPWLKYQQSFTTGGYDAYLRSTYALERQGAVYIQLRYEARDRTVKSVSKPTDDIKEEKRFKCRLNLDYAFDEGIRITSRVEFSTHRLTSYHTGVLLLQDLSYKSGFPLSGNVRWAWYHTSSFDARLYAYERDVLYAFSVPAYYGKGFRTYLNLKYQPYPKLSFWLRYARTNFFDRDEVGSGLDRINANHKSELKLQARIKF